MVIFLVVVFPVHYETKAKLYTSIAVKRKSTSFVSITGILDNTDGVNKDLLKFTLAECLNINYQSNSTSVFQ